MDPNCIFCQIANHKIPAKIKYEDEDFVAFDDIHPKAKVHILLIPKRHIHSVDALTDQDEELIGKMILTAKKVAEEAGIGHNFRLVTNSGPDAGQAVDHLHFHILGGNKLGDIA